jgi:hypothetical protein
MKYERIFIFGCSFTKHQWPTWADIIRYNSDIPVENWGYGGIGNVGIFHRMVECDLKNKFTEKDLILVLWSSWSREDRFKSIWMASGNVFGNIYYGEKFTKNYWHRNNDVIKNSTALISASKLYKLAYQGHIIKPAEPESCENEKENQDNEIYNFYMSHVDQSIDIFPTNLNSQFEGSCMDSHPDIKLHIYFYENYVRKKLNFLPEIKNKKELLELQHKISNSVNKKMTFENTMDTIVSITQEFDNTLNERPLGF